MNTPALSAPSGSDSDDSTYQLYETDNESCFTTESKDIILDDNLESSEDPLSIWAVFSNEPKAIKAFLSDMRHVGIKFTRKRGDNFILFRCSGRDREDLPCPARVRFKFTDGVWTITVAEHEHPHDTSIRRISHQEVIEDRLRAMLILGPDRKLKSLQTELESFYGASVTLGLVHAAKTNIQGRRKKDEENEFTRLPSLIERLRSSDPGGKYELDTENGKFRRLGNIDGVYAF